MNSLERIERYKAFKSFLENSEPKYEEISRSDKKIQTLNSYYNLCVCPGGSAGGANERLLEIFYGQRPFDTQRFDPFDRNRLKVLVEYGAGLHYNLLDNGRVVAVLYPAKTDHFSPTEEAILVSGNIDPHDLPRVYKLQFELLNAYMRCTSLDGEPSKIDRLRVFLLRLTRPLLVEGKMQPTRIWTHTVSILKFSMSVGLSGFLLAVITAITVSPSPNYSSDIGQANKALSSIEQKIETTSSTLEEIRKSMPPTGNLSSVKK